ncbi:hypothetical protein VSR17_29390 [Cupriavidus taiwanensis]|uniref:Uncharacterized protein n=2 Tax=Cupriavidus TaxID=106589 RepID=A0A375GSF3_9BURK|nr:MULTISPECIES: hypothetical protein [Cupriavidus]MCO4865777.1 hypothetical protein [Cupriavidus sp. WGlv3]ULX56088.1 hypothetical protein A9P79_29435 [Cupriavidus taiwanensis]SOY74041.1 hypothetical protein CBM2588_P100024 [Cupriavidus taiwanensis]SOY77137.1 hypothetical protein CBM2585_P90022 [Cupriavidus taiwanensis]SOY77399.1 hypothetical protein CBM2589_P90022 [Cupriavidus taiwanensis]
MALDQRPHDGWADDSDRVARVAFQLLDGGIGIQLRVRDHVFQQFRLFDIGFGRLGFIPRVDHPSRSGG